MQQFIQLPSWRQEIIDNGGGEPVQPTANMDFLAQQERARIVLEGLPGGGKTTIAEQLGGIPQFPSIVNHATQNQAPYIQNDIYKSRLTDTMHGPVLLDRDFTSTLAFAYARDQVEGTTYYPAIKTCYQELLGTRLKLGDIYIWLDVSTQESLRRKHDKNHGHPYWGDETFLEAMNEFYTKHFEHLQHITNVVKIDTNKTTNPEATRIVQELLEELQ